MEKKEAMKILKDFHDKSALFSVRTALDTVIPELKENEDEDERIRKALIKLVKKAGEGYENVIDGVSIENTISWLEKQGKHDMGISEATKQELEDNLNKALEKETPESCNEFLEKRGEQEPTIIIPKFRVGDVIRPKCSMTEYTIESISGGCYRGQLWRLPIGCDDDYELVEQKPAWSEEDCLQLDAAINIVTNSGHTCTSDWLKSIKERYNWKPSDEQMQALSNAGNSFRPFEEGHKVLWSLYNDLKKLKS